MGGPRPAHNLTHGRAVVGLDAAAERVDKQFLRQRADENFRALE